MNSVERRYAIYCALLGFGIGLMIAGGVLDKNNFMGAKLLIGALTGIGGIVGRLIGRRQRCGDD